MQAGARRGQGSTVVTVPRAAEAKGQSMLVFGQQAAEHSVEWTEDTVDNEHLGRKKSKKCCVFHKKREFGESSSESEFDSEGGYDSEDSTDRALRQAREARRAARLAAGKSCGHKHCHGHSHGKPATAAVAAKAGSKLEG